MTHPAEGHHPAQEPLVLIVDDDAGIRTYLRRLDRERLPRGWEWWRLP